MNSDNVLFEQLIISFVALFGQLVFAFPSEYNSYDHHDYGQIDHHAPSPYHFEYSVNDQHTHDIKSQHEESDGHGNVKGSYSLVEPDGSTRIVEYTADHEHGFNAKVKKIDAPTHHDEHDVYHEPILSYKPSLNYY